MSGAIQRLPGEKFADFAARQKQCQKEEKELFESQMKSLRFSKQGRRERRYLEVITSDHDHSMDY
jgi:hypothetical protein